MATEVIAEAVRQRLSASQRGLLGSWYLIGRGSTVGYNAGELAGPKRTLDALLRYGLIEQPHPGWPSFAWCAVVTELGVEVAEQCSKEDDDER